MAELISGPTTPGPILIPDWDQVVTLAPRPDTTRHDYFRARALLERAGAWAADRATMERVLHTARSAGAIATEDELARVREIARRRAAALEISRSAVPAWRQKIIRVLTAADNVEDLVSTVERLSRPIQAMIPGGRLIGGAQRAAATGLERIQQVLRGPSIIGRSAKSRAERERRANARARRAKTRKLAAAGAWLADKYGAILEGAQASDTVFGIGVSLGPIFGAIEETQDRLLISAWEAGKWLVARAAANVPLLPEATREDLRAQADQAVERIRQTGTPIVAQIPRIALPLEHGLNPFALAGATAHAAARLGVGAAGTWFERLTRAAQGASYISQDNPHFGRAEHALAIRAATLALPPLAAALHIATALAPQARWHQLQRAPTRVLNPVTRALLEDQGAGLDYTGAAYGAWAEPSARAGALVEKAIDDGARARTAWLPDAEHDDTAQFLHALLEGAQPSIAYALTASVEGIATIYDPDTRIEMMLYHTGAYPPPDIPLATLTTWWQANQIALAEDPELWDERAFLKITARYWPLPPALA